MRQSKDKNWQAASAYIDNELSCEERAAFEARLLNEPDLAETLDEVQYVSMSLNRMQGDKKKRRQFIFPELRLRNLFIGGALAASLTAAVVYSAVTPDVTVQNPALVHEAFTSQEMTFQSMSNLQHAAYSSGLFPDLSAGNFTLIGELKTEYGIAAHYTGRRNCRLTLIAGENIPPINDPTMQSIGWTGQMHEYLLVNKGMDPERFKLIGEYLRNAEADKPPVSRLALREKISKTKSCS